jgi:hypothetical protein
MHPYPKVGLYEEALGSLSRAVELAPSEPLLLAALAAECLYADQVGKSCCDRVEAMGRGARGSGVRKPD